MTEKTRASKSGQSLCVSFEKDMRDVLGVVDDDVFNVVSNVIEGDPDVPVRNDPLVRHVDLCRQLMGFVRSRRSFFFKKNKKFFLPKCKKK